MPLMEHFSDEHAALLSPHVRPAFVPVVELGEATGPVTKIGGVPWLASGSEWPVCPNCSEPMELLVQIDLESLPPGARDHGRGLAQLFYCLNDEPLCEVDCEAFFPFAKSVVARVLDKRSAGSDAEPREVPNAIAPKRIVGWEKVEDLPNCEELGELGIDAGFDGPLYEEICESERPLAGDKLGGWPCWVQGIEYPACPECKGRMQLVFQIDSNDQVGVQWGDLGCAHLTQCAAHPDRLAFGWACG